MFIRMCKCANECAYRVREDKGKERRCVRMCAYMCICDEERKKKKRGEILRARKWEKRRKNQKREQKTRTRKKEGKKETRFFLMRLRELVMTAET